MIYNGISWYDQNNNTVNAHGACILQEGDTFYLFGEYKTDDVNKYIGFSCYSTRDFTNWKFEGLALPPQKDGLLGENRVGERVKVLKCPQTGKYIMLMHTDDLKYNDPHIGLAVSDRIDGKFTFKGPLYFQGEPIHMWDMGTFVDDDSTAYLLTHEGNIYRLSEDYTEAVELVAKNLSPGGESPALFKEDGIYYLMFSNKTGWERNDNYYLTATDLHGPWEHKGLFCKEGSLTCNTQCSFVFMYEREDGKLPVYVGDRWSFPRQGSAATLVLLPLKTKNGMMEIEEYLRVWSPDEYIERCLPPENKLDFYSNTIGESCSIPFTGERIMLFGETSKHGGYGEVEIKSEQGEVVHRILVDFYSLAGDSGLRYRSPHLVMGNYVLTLRVKEQGGVWITKNGTRYGSDDSCVKLKGWRVE